MMPDSCPICGQSKLRPAGSHEELLSGRVPVLFEVYECLSGAGQCVATRDDGAPGTRIYVPAPGRVTAAGDEAGGTLVVSTLPNAPAAPAVVTGA